MIIIQRNWICVWCAATLDTPFISTWNALSGIGVSSSRTLQKSVDSRVEMGYKLQFSIAATYSNGQSLKVLHR